MWVLVAVFVSGMNISTQQIGFYESKEACMADQAIIKADDERYAVYGQCLPSKGVASYE